MPVPKKRPMLFRILRFFMKFTPVRPDIILSDGDAIAGLTCIHTPGHTPGSSCFLDPAEKVLFAGDTILTPGGSVHGPSGEFSADPVQARQSVERIAPLDFDILLSGHGEPVRPGAAARVREFLAEEKA